MSAISRRRFIRLTVTQASLLGFASWSVVTCGSAGCGTIMHPERRGQPAGPLDWKIVALDAAGLLLFFVPGVIAFAVDFNNGTIYLPPDHYGLKAPNADGQQLVAVPLPAERMTVGKLETLVSQHAQREIHLQPGTYQTEKLETIDQFWTATDKYRSPQKPA